MTASWQQQIREFRLPNLRAPCGAAIRARPGAGAIRARYISDYQTPRPAKRLHAVDEPANQGFRLRDFLHHTGSHACLLPVTAPQP